MLDKLPKGARYLALPAAPATFCGTTSTTQQGHVLDTSGPLGTLWVGFGLGAFYIALIWLNTLLGVFLTPLFIIPGTWLMDAAANRKRRNTTTGPAATARTPA